MRGQLALAALLVMAGCDGCGERPGRPPALDPSASKVHVDPPSDKVFEAAWSKRLEALSPRDAAQAKTRFSYRIKPGCALRYQLRTLRTSEVADGRPPTEDAVDAELKLDERDKGYRVHLSKMEATFTADGVSRKQAADASLPTAVVETDGARWTEIGGPSTLWAAHSAIPAVLTFFPRLPEKPDVGSSVVWKIKTHPVRVTKALPRARAKAGAKGLPDPVPTIDRATVKVLRYVALGDADAGVSEQAMVLDVGWSVVDDRSEPMLSQQRESWRGRYLVSASGRLLHAFLMANVSSWWSTQPGESNLKRGSSARELRLVEACDGAVLTPAPGL